MNGYFQLVTTQQGTGIKVYPPEDGGTAVRLDIVMEYLNLHKIQYDAIALANAFKNAGAEISFFTTNQISPERESYKLDISADRMSAVAFFYPPTEGGDLMTEDEFVRDLIFKKVKFGICQDNIKAFFQKRQYCTEITVAQGKAPRNGSDASIEYAFTTDLRARPTMKEDGSVDYFHLNLINNCRKGDLLATLIPADPGEPGQNVYGEPIGARTVKILNLHYGRNVIASEDKLKIYADADGHVLLQDEKVVVSNIISLKNVDVSTGNVDFEGSVEVSGDVAANFSIRAGGNIQVKGNVEGAQLEAGADIILERGINGMGRGIVNAGGNVVTKYIENAFVTAGGNINAESIIHSEVSSGKEICVEGKRGFIAGGHVVAAEKITARTFGSEMGVSTQIDVGVDPQVKLKLRNLQNDIVNAKKTLETIKPTIDGIKQKLKNGAKLSPEQIKYAQQLIELNKSLVLEISEKMEKVTVLQNRISDSHRAEVVVMENAYPGTVISIGELSMVIKNTVKYSRFVIADGEVKITSV